MIALWMLGCAPLVGLPAPVPMAHDAGGQLGAHAAVLGTLGRARPPPPLGDHAYGQLSALTPLKRSDRLTLGVVAGFGGQQHLVSGGVVARVRIREEAADHWLLQLEGGVAWAGVGVAWSRQIGEHWVYAAPSILLKDTLWARLPAGVRLRVGEHVQLDLEAGLTTSTARVRLSAPYGPSALGYLGAGLVVAR